MKRIACAVAGLLPLAAFAVEPMAATSVPNSALAGVGSGMAGEILQLVLGLAVVLGVIFALAWLLRRVQQTSPRGGQLIELLGSRALGPRDRLVLVQVGTEQILLGISPGQITALHVLKEPIAAPVKTEQATPEFAQRLMELLGKDHKDTK